MRQHLKNVINLMLNLKTNFLSVCSTDKSKGFHPHHEGQRVQQLRREMWEQAAGLKSTWLSNSRGVSDGSVLGVPRKWLRLHGHRHPRADARRGVLARAEQNGQVQ